MGHSPLCASLRVPALNLMQTLFAHEKTTFQRLFLTVEAGGLPLSCCIIYAHCEKFQSSFLICLIVFY